MGRGTDLGVMVYVNHKGKKDIELHIYKYRMQNITHRCFVIYCQLISL